MHLIWRQYLKQRNNGAGLLFILYEGNVVSKNDGPKSNQITASTNIMYTWFILPQYWLHPVIQPISSTETICLNGKVYEEACVSRCPYHCADLQAGTQCVEDIDCTPGCTCPNGTLEQDGECVPREECDCLDEDGNVFAPGDITVEECRNW